MSKLSKSVRTIGKTFEKSANKYYGDLGLVLNGRKQVEVIGRPGYVYVRLRTVKSETIEAFNDKVDLQYGLPVILRRNGSRYEVTGVNRERYSTWDAESSSVPRHAKTHTFDKDGEVIGNDSIFISGYQFLPGLLSPFPGNASTNAFIYPYVDRYSGTWTYYGNTGTASLIPYKPQSGTSLVLVSIDYNTGNPHYLCTTGSFIPSSVTGMSQILGYIPNNIPGNILPVGVVRLTPDTQTLDWRNVYNVRTHITKKETGTSSTSTPLAIQDEGIPLGFPGTINFVGANVDASISGSVVRVFVTGGSGGGAGGGVESVSGDGVDNTDPDNPVINYPTPGDIGAELAGAAATAEANAKSYADGLAIGLWDDRGSFDASGGTYPSSGGSGTAGAILKGDTWTISVAGTLPTGQVVEIGDVIRALIDTPGNTQANWAITQNNIGYVAENAANKVTTMSGNTTSNIVFLTAKAIYDWAVGLFSQIGHAHAASDITSGTMATARLGSGTASASTALHGDQTYKTVREVLTGNRTYYVRTDGSDSNNGLANTAGGAFLTIQKAIDVAVALDLSIYNVTIQVGNGTYTAAVTLKGITGSGTVTLLGDATTPSNVVISTTSSAAISAANGVKGWVVSGFKLQTTTSGVCVDVSDSANIKIANIDFGACANYHMQVYSNGYLTINTNYTISAAAQIHMVVYNGGFIDCRGKTITFTTNPTAFTYQFINIGVLGGVLYSTNTFTNKAYATGTRYYVDRNGVLDTGGGGATYLPGDVGGSTATGGQYT